MTDAQALAGQVLEKRRPIHGWRVEELQDSGRYKHVGHIPAVDLNESSQHAVYRFMQACIGLRAMPT